MDRLRTWKVWLKLVVTFLVGVACVSPSLGDSLDDLHKKAVKEGIVSFYGTLAQVNAEKILPVFEPRAVERYLASLRNSSYQSLEAIGNTGGL